MNECFFFLVSLQSAQTKKQRKTVQKVLGHCTMNEKKGQKRAGKAIFVYTCGRVVSERVRKTIQSGIFFCF